MRDREEFYYHMAREGMPLHVVRSILRDAATVQRLAAEACNRELTHREWERTNKAEQRIREQMTELGWPEPKIGGDPRGACVKLRVPSGFTDDWGREGVCVPTRRF